LQPSYTKGYYVTGIRTVAAKLYHQSPVLFQFCDEGLWARRNQPFVIIGDAPNFRARFTIIELYSYSAVIAGHFVPLYPTMHAIRHANINGNMAWYPVLKAENQANEMPSGYELLFYTIHRIDLRG